MSCKPAVMPGFRIVLLMQTHVLSSDLVAQTAPKRSAEPRESKLASADLTHLPEYKVILVSDCDSVVLQTNGETLEVGLLGVEALPVVPN
jgi:hypothetical protein